MESLSKFLYANNTENQFGTEDEGICDGVKITEDKSTILRFINGWLDGDEFDEDGNLINVRPAVEGPGHFEFWRKNKLHRDNGEPAVISNGFSDKEWWENGKRIK